MSDRDDERRARAAARRSRIILRKSSSEAGEPDPSPIRGEAAVSLVTRLSATSWSLARLPMPSYARAQIPCRFIARRST
jgi:hypothetical protein